MRDFLNLRKVTAMVADVMKSGNVLKIKLQNKKCKLKITTKKILKSRKITAIVADVMKSGILNIIKLEPKNSCQKIKKCKLKNKKKYTKVTNDKWRRSCKVALFNCKMTDFLNSRKVTAIVADVLKSGIDFKKRHKRKSY